MGYKSESQNNEVKNTERQSPIILNSDNLHKKVCYKNNQEIKLNTEHCGQCLLLFTIVYKYVDW